MREVPTEFKDGGFDMKLVERQGEWAIYTQSKRGKVIAYEVVRIRQRPESKLPGGRIAPAGEYYPKNSEWGSYAWSCISLERAREKLATERTRSQQPRPLKSEGKRTTRTPDSDAAQPQPPFSQL